MSQNSNSQEHKSISLPLEELEQILENLKKFKR
jgi:hypothetical protein